MNTASIVKRSAGNESFDPLKLHSSIVAACYAVRTLEGEAHVVAQHVVKAVVDWLVARSEVTSADIRQVASNILRQYHPEAAYIYDNHRHII